MRRRQVTIITGEPGASAGGWKIEPFTFGLVGALGVLVALLIARSSGSSRPCWSTSGSRCSSPSDSTRSCG
jgi:hypothetical protein